MQGHHAAAGSHIRSGSKLLEEFVYDQPSGKLQHPVLGSMSRAESHVPLEVLARIFAGLNNQAATVRAFISDFFLLLWLMYP